MSAAEGAVPDWYRDAVIYELHVRAFADADGDGVGDFKDLIGKLDYLSDLGVTALWLLPFYPSPLRDEGYDIADYRRINPTYGDMRTFRRFVSAAHQRSEGHHRAGDQPHLGCTSLVPACPPGGPGSVERDFYVWSDDDRRYPDARIIFGDYETSTGPGTRWRAPTTGIASTTTSRT
ncbi:MAG: alpha-amylase family glycosyl hydrolase [Microthrixaceae bacterium]